MSISAKQVKDLRDKTGAGFMECKKALAESNGDFDGAVDYLRKRNAARGAKLASREMKQGWIGSYVHPNGRVGVLVELTCETDFVAKNEQFQVLLKDLSMHIAAMDPKALSAEDLDPAVVAKEREILRESDELKGKPAEMIEKIVDGKMKRYFAEVCLLEQKFVKDDKMTVGELLTSAVSGMGENISLRRFSRFEIGK